MSANDPVADVPAKEHVGVMDLTEIFLETDRLVLVPRSSLHAESILEEYDERVAHHMRYAPPESLKAVSGLIQEQQSLMEAGKSLFMSVFLNGTQEFLGCISFENTSSNQPELGMWLKRGAQGCRYGEEAARRVLLWSRDQFPYEQLIWPCAEENIASRKLAESLGGSVQRHYLQSTWRAQGLKYIMYNIPRMVF